MATKLIDRREPTEDERKRGAEVVFVRYDPNYKSKHTILATRVYESWEQWGATREVLGDNVDDVDAWRREQPDAEGEE